MEGVHRLQRKKMLLFVVPVGPELSIILLGCVRNFFSSMASGVMLIDDDSVSRLDNTNRAILYNNLSRAETPCTVYTPTNVQQQTIQYVRES